MKTTHTHRGTCQACGRHHAVDNVTRKVAKHGYTVDFGYFHGVCPGGRGYKPAEFDVSLTHATIVQCTEAAKTHDQDAANLRAGVTKPLRFERYNKDLEVTKRGRWGTYKTKGGYEVLDIKLATPEEFKRTLDSCIYQHESNASGLRAHCKFLVSTVLPRFGRELFPAVEEKAPPKAEAVVDVKAAKVVGAFTTKAARKNELDKLNRAYSKAIDAIQAIYLALPREARTEAKTEVYYAPHDLHNWRPRHAEATLREFPEAAPYVEEINTLVKAREAVKAAP